MATPRAFASLAFVLALPSCGDGTPPPKSVEEIAAEKCPRVHLDRLAGDWISATGDPKTRMRFVEDAGGYVAYWIGGDLRKLRMQVVKREKDLQLTEVPSGKRKARHEAGEEAVVRLYVEPKPKTCALSVFTGRVDGSGKELIQPKPVELLEFPAQQGVRFTYEPPAAPAFLGEAARRKKVADQQLAELGEPRYEHPLGTVPVGLWTSADEDGDASCTYEMQLFFDHMPVDDAGAIPAGPVKDGLRHWYHEWHAPYSGNHHFEVHRYRVCGGERTLLGTAGVEAVLN